MHTDRIPKYKALEKNRNSKLLVYITGDRPNLETQIASDVINFMIPHLDSFGKTEKISLLLHTNGGDTLAAWSISNLIRQFCTKFEVIVPLKALSSGTLISLGADSILMTKQAILGPIDPSVTTPLNPGIPGAPPQAKVPVSVEAIKGYLELARGELGIKDDSNLVQVMLKLSDLVHPLVLGQVYRARSQIQMLARKLIANQLKDEAKIDKIISFLCSGSGSHDYTINRREARDILGLSVEKPDQPLYELLKEIIEDIQEELKLNNRYDPNSELGNNPKANYSLKRGLLESVTQGCASFISEGLLQKIQVNAGGLPKIGIEDTRTFEGWRKI